MSATAPTLSRPDDCLLRPGNTNCGGCGMSIGLTMLDRALTQAGQSFGPASRSSRSSAAAPARRASRRSRRGISPERVAELAGQLGQADGTPLLERLRFLAISTTNLARLFAGRAMGEPTTSGSERCQRPPSETRT